MKTKVIRKIVRIDEEKCDGCGLCVPQCKEGAIQVVEGKARLVSELYCDGLGACLGECPRGAITIEEREAEEFDEKAVKEHLKAAHEEHEYEPAQHFGMGQGCPSARVMSFLAKNRATAGPGPRPGPAHAELATGAAAESALSQWPVQLALVPVSAPYLRGADLLIAADCVPFAYAGFHRDLLEGKAVLVGCPKLDDTGPYLQKLARIFAECEPKSVTVAHMEVPCCFGLARLVQEAMKLSGKNIPVRGVTISIQGEMSDDVAEE
jgi:Pyruvate/2-oxoacid:ferredoxin oxidoreductase delta subunit